MRRRLAGDASKSGNKRGERPEGILWPDRLLVTKKYCHYGLREEIDAGLESTATVTVGFISHYTVLVAEHHLVI
uniref:Uncharacterized protein n=1 Tax=Sphaerodactylus townsendi TaxID=933632 RepID=A0ACB8G2Q4_9SAUR